MLVLSRKLNEAIVIDGDIRITVAGIRGNHVRLGIQAPDSVEILREELCEWASTAQEDVELSGAPAAGGQACGCSLAPDQ